MFIIKDFCPSILEILLIKAINLAEKFINTPNEGKLVVKRAGKAVSYDNSKPWTRKKAAYSMKA